MKRALQRQLSSRLIRPAYKQIKRTYDSFLFKRRVRGKIESQTPCKIVIGASGIFQHGWIPSEVETLNLLSPRDWKCYFRNDQIDSILAEHVWEHLTTEQGTIAAKICYQYLKPGGYMRIAVPDGLHPDSEYIDQVKVGGQDSKSVIERYGPDAADHKLLYTYHTLKDVFERAGFRVDLLEYFDEEGYFHYKEWHPADGIIHRSKNFDHRNRNGELRYTSIILDAWKLDFANTLRLRQGNLSQFVEIS